MSKKLLLCCVGLLVMMSFSCKKFVDNQKRNYVLGIMTDGRWYLQRYADQGIDNTSDFSEFEFQFYENNKIDAINTLNAAVSSGVWSEDIDNVSMTVNFTSSVEKLKRLNYTWKITDAYTDAVYAETNTSAGLITIRLVKK